MDLEIYTRIKGYEQYAVSNFGNLMNVETQKFLKQRNDTKGYVIVTISKDGIRKDYRLHRLIAEHFIDNPDNLPIIDHIDGNKSNNEISNLRWATQQTNCQNRKKRENTTSIFKGVYFYKPTKKWKSNIKINSKSIHIGYFDTEIEAAFAYNEYLIENGLEDFPMNEI